MKRLFYISCLFFSFFLLFSCQEKKQGEQNQEQIGSAPVNPTKLYAMYCVACHGEDGQLGVGGAKNLAQSTLEKPAVIKMISEGSENKKMMGYGKLLNEQELDALAEFVINLR